MSSDHVTWKLPSKSTLLIFPVRGIDIKLKEV